MRHQRCPRRGLLTRRKKCRQGKIRHMLQLSSRAHLRSPRSRCLFGDTKDGTKTCMGAITLVRLYIFKKDGETAHLKFKMGVHVML